MKKLAMLLACFVLAGTQFLWAQGTVITGTVTGKEDLSDKKKGCAKRHALSLCSTTVFLFRIFL